MAKEYEFKPLLQLSIQEEEDQIPQLLEFTWEIISFTSNELKIQLVFEVPPYLSSRQNDD